VNGRRMAITLLMAGISLSAAVRVQGQRGGPPAPTGSAPKAAAPIDLTGYWVSIVSEGWRYRMVTPTRGDYQGVPMTPDAVKVADAWDPAADTSAGNQCRSYGAAAIMRVPGRVHISWPDDNTLRLETDAGTQTRTLRFDPSTGSGSSRPQSRDEKTPVRAEPSWQGDSVAQWETPGAGRGGRGAAPGAPGTGSLKVVTTNLKTGYLRKNGVPYSEDATLTEYFDIARERSGAQLLVVTAVVDDAKYLRQPFIVSTQFRKQADARGWDPSPCSATW
jgi:hypothetical protein